MTVTATDRLLDWVQNARLADFPQGVVDQVKTVLYDSIGAALSATSGRYDIGAVLYRYTTNIEAGTASQVYGSRLRTSSATAAMINGTFSYYLDSESHHPGAIMHAIAVVGPAALAIAERNGSSGAQLVEALVVGIDVACRVSYALDGTALYDRGFHPTCVAGVFGSMAAASKLLGLRDHALKSAFGLAGTQSSGLLGWVDDPHEHARPFNMGLAARNGVYAAELAAAGFSGIPTIFDGKYPLGRAFSGEWHEDELATGLGERFMVAELYFKMYACCAFIHPGLDGLLEILSTERLEAKDIAVITLRFPTSGYHVIDDNPLRSHNAQYVLALAGCRGTVEFYDILRDQRSDPAVAELERRVRVVGDADLEKGYPDVYRTIIEVETAAGRRFTRDVPYPKGSPERPATKAELRNKFRRLTQGVVDDEQRRQIEQDVWGLETLSNVSGFCARLGLAHEEVSNRP